jgi:hypothetical protein
VRLLWEDCELEGGSQLFDNIHQIATLVPDHSDDKVTYSDVHFLLIFIQYLGLKENTFEKIIPPYHRAMTSLFGKLRQKPFCSSDSNKQNLQHDSISKEDPPPYDSTATPSRYVSTLANSIPQWKWTNAECRAGLPEVFIFLPSV